MFMMVKNIVSVCIFCFLCATHSPCQSHAEVTHGGKLYHDNKIPFKDPDNALIQDEADLHENGEKSPHRSKLSVQKTINSRFKKDINNDNNNSNKKVNNISVKEDEHLESLFRRFGNGNTMSLSGFQKLMKEFDLLEELYMKVNHQPFAVLEHVHTYEEHDNTTRPKCVDRNKIYETIFTEAKLNETKVIDNMLIQKACPAILYSIVGGCSTTHDEHIDHHIDDHQIDATTSKRVYAWFYSLLAITLISACGILGLAIIPMMQKRFYQPLLQFLVSLAVGTLAGDALLHLLPHAMTSHSDHDHGDHDEKHEENMWKGFIAMLGLIFFFLMERIIMLGAKWRKKRQLKDKLPSKLKVIKPDMSTQLTNAAEKQCKHKYSSFPYCYDEIKMDVEGHQDDLVFQVGGTSDNWESHNNTASTGLDEMSNHPHSDITERLKKLGHSHNVEKNQNLTECPNESNNTNCSEVNKMLSTEFNKMLTNDHNKDDTDSIEYTVILREHENRHHGHSHTHGHVHAAPKTLSSVAWMVIMGDGLHNFTDGMAIGAAFSSSIAGGFSTAVAVFCHELPHELGDFAMLLKAGMSMKQALFYNLLSSILCLFGNIFGIWVGNTEHASQFIFAAAAGMFLYIALVDMIPELSSGHEAEGTLIQCFLHLGGLLLGFAVMALIALYEHDLKTIFHET